MDTKPTSFVAVWFGTAYIALVFSILLLVYLSIAKTVIPTTHNFKLYAALPQNITTQSDSVSIKDARSKIVENFFRKYVSPLSSYGEAFVLVADKYQIDYRFLPAIAMQESNGGKKIIKNSNNPFGYGIYGELVLRFSSWEEAIERVGRALREDYLDQGLTTPQKMMTKYTPPSAKKGGLWAKSVSSFMDQLR